jgi:hypothetical protein
LAWVAHEAMSDSLHYRAWLGQKGQRYAGPFAAISTSVLRRATAALDLHRTFDIHIRSRLEEITPC